MFLSLHVIVGTSSFIQTPSRDEWLAFGFGFGLSGTCMGHASLASCRLLSFFCFFFPPCQFRLQTTLDKRSLIQFSLGTVIVVYADERVCNHHHRRRRRRHFYLPARGGGAYIHNWKKRKAISFRSRKRITEVRDVM